MFLKKKMSMIKKVVLFALICSCGQLLLGHKIEGREIEIERERERALERKRESIRERIRERNIIRKRSKHWGRKKMSCYMKYNNKAAVIIKGSTQRLEVLLYILNSPHILIYILLYANNIFAQENKDDYVNKSEA